MINEINFAEGVENPLLNPVTLYSDEAANQEPIIIRIPAPTTTRGNDAVVRLTATAKNGKTLTVPMYKNDKGDLPDAVIDVWI